MTNIEDIKGRIESLTKIKEESNRAIIQLNIIISEKVTARDIETKRKDNLQNNIDKLNMKLKQTEESEIQDDN